MLQVQEKDTRSEGLRNWTLNIEIKIQGETKTMTKHINRTLLLLAVGLFLASACSRKDTAKDETTAAKAGADMATKAMQPAPNIVELAAVGKTFIGPSEIPAGWTTFKFTNKSDMVHFAIIDVLPKGVSAKQLSDDVMAPFQDAMNAMIAGDEAATKAAFEKFPEWIAQLTRNGGPGILGAHETGQTTVYIEPGEYVVECYVKTNGVFHSTPASDGTFGMMLPLTVTANEGKTAEPKSNMTISITNAGYKILDGALHQGANTIRVNFDEQQAFPSVTGNDIHLMKITSADDARAANDWMDWRKTHGLESPAPVKFLGGINDLPAGTHGYFTVDLQPGDYEFIGEQPDPKATGFVLPVTVVEEG